MNNGLMALNRSAAGQQIINLLVENFSERKVEHRARSVKHKRFEFTQGLRKIRDICEKSYHNALLNYFPENTADKSVSTTTTKHSRGVWYTDPHLLCKRSDAAPLLHSLHSVLGRCHFAVSVGDEFDFAWSEVKDPITTAVNYKIKLAQRYPKCQFYTVSGNHDGSDEYIKALETASLDLPNIIVQRYAVKLGKYLFTHGDCVHWKEPTVNALEEYRRSFNDGWKPNLADKLVNQLTQSLGLHCKVPEYLLELMIPRKVQAERILKFIKQLDSNLLEGAQTICFGHTHKGFRGFEHAGFRFYNGGAHEQGFKPALHRFSIKSSEANSAINC